MVIIYLIVNLLIDLLYALLDPRIRYVLSKITPTASRARIRREHFVATLDETPLGPSTRSASDEDAATSGWTPGATSAGGRCSGSPRVMIVVHLVVALFPGSSRPSDPTSAGVPAGQQQRRPAAGHPLGFTQQGCDVFARIVYGTRASLSVGLIITIVVFVIGGIDGRPRRILRRLGRLACCCASATSSSPSRYILAAVVVMSAVFSAYRTVWVIVARPSGLRLAADRPDHPRCRDRGQVTPTS